MKSVWILFLIGCGLAGCHTPEEPVAPVVNSGDALIFLEPGLRPEELFFPDYLLMEDFELNQHGIIPETSLVGAGIRTELNLKTVRCRFGDVLASNHWKIDGMEVGKQSFRMMASLKADSVEIRAVQGSGATQIFILYQPRPVANAPAFN